MDLGGTEKVVNADPRLPFAAAFLDTVPEEPIETLAVARGVGISYERAKAIMYQLQALGHVAYAHDDTWMTFEPHGLTVPTITRDEASPPGMSPDEAAGRQIARDTHDYEPDDPVDPSRRTSDEPLSPSV